MITDAHRKELLSFAWVEAIAACCGLSSCRPYPDYGVDIILKRVATVLRSGESKPIRVPSGYSLELQLKSTVAAMVRDDEVVYDLKADAYSKLADADVGCERILVVLVLPHDEQSWVDATEDGLRLRGCAYWISLRGRPVEPGKTKVRIAIPRANVFSPQTLECIMNCVSKGEPL